MQLKYQDDKVQRVLCDPRILQKEVGLEIGRKIKLRLNQLEATENFNQYLTRVGLGKPHDTELDIESLKSCKILNVKGVLDYHGRKNEWIIH